MPLYCQDQDQNLRDGLGAKAIHSEAVKSQSGISGYRIAAYAAVALPGEYRGLVYSKWLRSLRYGNDFFRLICAEDYYESYHTHIYAILQRPETMVRLAVLADDADVVLGFAVSRGTILDYVHVHRDQRRLGIGTSLIPPNITTITHLTKTGLSIWASKYKWKFNPFA